MKILAFFPIKEDGTSFYRGLGPLNHLEKVFDIQVTDGGTSAVSWDMITKYDVLFFQRPSTFIDIIIMEMAKKCNRPIIIDYDDDYLNIPPTNPRHDLYADPHRVQQIRKAIDLADFILTSTISIKESIVANTGKDRTRIQVVPNGVDEILFDISPINNLSLRNVILWRGGDTHDADIARYLDKMVDLYNELPKFKWAFMGHAPEAFMARIDTSRILLYPFEDVMTYFDWLFELRPAITIVPWEENAFNHAKTNCAWLESTLAGAATVFPKWSTEFVEGMAGYNDPESFYKMTAALLSNLETREFHYRISQETLEKRFTLGSLNPTRISVIHEVMEERITVHGKLGTKHVKYRDTPERFTNKEFFDYTWQHQLNQNFQQYANGHFAVATWLHEKFNPTSVVELGCGPAPMIEKFCDLKVPQVAGFEINPYFKEYFIKRNPHYAHAFLLGSFLEADLTGVFDLCVSIEVFEHIPHEQLMPFIKIMADHFKVLYFSSTPYRSSQKFDKEWNHCNVKTHEAWVQLFEENGFQYVENPKKIAIWDALFVSTRLRDQKSKEVLEEEHLSQ